MTQTSSLPQRRVAAADATFAKEGDRSGVPPKGSVISGKLLVGELLGRGGMGIVVAGEHLQLRQQVAIKFLKPTLAQSPEALTRFLREARAAASLRSEHAVRIYDVGTTEAGVPYMVMERLAGMSLEKRVAAEAPLPIGASVTMILEACDALAEAHAAGIVHRDVKPANLFYAQRADGRHAIKVLDFGISKSLISDAEGDANAVISASLTAPNTLLGSPQYMSPEQVRDARSVDPRSDIWGLGVILYELLTGRAPFESDSIPHLYALILASTPPAPRRHRPSLPSGLDTVISRCLEKSPGRRFQDVPALVRALAPYSATASERSKLARAGLGRRGRVIAVSAAALGLLGLGAASLAPRTGLAPNVAASPRAPAPSVPTLIVQAPTPTPAPSDPPPSAPPQVTRDAKPTKARERAPAKTEPPRVRDIRNIKLLE